jgi:hypothetical protein
MVAKERDLEREERAFDSEAGFSKVFRYSVPHEADRADDIGRAIEFGQLHRLRQRGISDAPAPMLPTEGFDYWASWLRERPRRKYDAVVLLTGPVGSSKSTLALRLALRLNPRFDLSWQLCYTSAELMAAYQRVQPGDVIWFDEGVRGLLAGDQATKEQKALIQALALIREKGAILIVCSPSIWLIAKQVRQGRASLWIHVLRRGLGLAHERQERIRYTPDQTIGFLRSMVCPYLLWNKFSESSRVWRDYIKEKNRHLDQFLQETRELLEGKRKKSSKDEEAEEDALAAAPAPPPIAAATKAQREARRRLKRAGYERARRKRLKERRAARKA